jgi:hypothetical protein
MYCPLETGMFFTKLKIMNINPHSAVIINDCNRPELAEALCLCKLNTNLYPVLIRLEDIKGLNCQFGPETLFLYPGNSARDIYHFGHFNGRAMFPGAKRIWMPPQPPVVTVETLDHPIDTKTTDVVVVDDVISSGDTLELLYKRNSWKFTKARWTAVTVISRQKKLKGYLGGLLSVYWAPQSGGRLPPINSLSSLLKDTEVRDSYIARNFADPEEVKACFT